MNGAKRYRNRAHFHKLGVIRSISLPKKISQPGGAAHVTHHLMAVANHGPAARGRAGSVPFCASGRPGASAGLGTGIFIRGHRDSQESAAHWQPGLRVRH